jgi:hypothetical protein
MLGGNGEGDNRNLAMFLYVLDGACGVSDHVSGVLASSPRKYVFRGENEKVEILNAAALDEFIQSVGPEAMDHGVAVTNVADGDFYKVADSPVGSSEE